eukprot:591869-Rhodomonas_salina.1
MRVAGGACTQLLALLCVTRALSVCVCDAGDGDGVSPCLSVSLRVSPCLSVCVHSCCSCSTTSSSARSSPSLSAPTPSSRPPASAAGLSLSLSLSLSLALSLTHKYTHTHTRTRPCALSVSVSKAPLALRWPELGVGCSRLTLAVAMSLCLSACLPACAAGRRDAGDSDRRGVYRRAQEAGGCHQRSTPHPCFCSALSLSAVRVVAHFCSCCAVVCLGSLNVGFALRLGKAGPGAGTVSLLRCFEFVFGERGQRRRDAQARFLQV